MSLQSQGASSQLVQDLNSYRGSNLINDVDIFEKYSAGMNLANNTPASLPATGFNPFGQQFTAQPNFRRDYINNLGAAVGGIIQFIQETKNPWSIFKYGQMPNGGKLVTIHQNIIRSRNYGQGSSNPFETNFGQATSRTYTWYLDKYSTNTYVDTQETMYFNNFSQINDYAYGKMRALIDGGILDEFYTMKLAFSVAAETMKVAWDIAPDDVTLGKAIMRHARKMQYFNSTYNEVGYIQATNRESLVCLVPVDSSVDLDWNVYAQMFSPEVARYPLEYIPYDVSPDVSRLTEDHVITAQDVIDGFFDADPIGVGNGLHVGDTIEAGTIVRYGTPGSPTAPKAGEDPVPGFFDGTTIAAVICHQGFLKVIDALPATITVQPNVKSRYTNIFLNYKSMFTIDTLLPAVFILTQAPAAVVSGIESDVKLENIGVPITSKPLAYGAHNDSSLNGPINPWGSEGEIAMQGPEGDKGDKGDTGAQGPKGDTGPQGPKGDKGDKGDPGEPATQAAKSSK